MRLQAGKFLLFVGAARQLNVLSVDSKTDELMQRIIRQRFSNHTIIAVAHKLDTVLDFDKVALLDAGELKEFDSPHKLLADGQSQFCQLYRTFQARRHGDDVQE